MVAQKRVSQLKSNLIANYAGKGWGALMALAFVPLYIRLLGIESYGLIGFFATLQSVFALLDYGLNTTLNRELARCSAVSNRAQEMHDLVRTLEIIYWGLAIVGGFAVLLLAPLIASKWVNTKTLPISVVQNAVMLMGLVMAFQWLQSFYFGGLIGLQRQVLYSALNSGWYTLRFAGAALVLWLISPTILAFFAWQLFINIVGAVLAALALWHSLPKRSAVPRFRIAYLRSVWRFVAGMSAISVTVLLLTQMDKIILSRLVSLEAFGYYSLAWSVASSLGYLTSPVFTVVFPSFSKHVVLGDTEALKRLYHRACQFLSVIILPAAILVVFFAPEVLLLWTRDAVLAQSGHNLVSLLMIGTVLNSLMNLPYALQLANGWTSLALCTNVISIVVLIPVLVFMVSYYGEIGAAVVWVVLNSGYVFIQLQVMHRRLLKGEQWRWYRDDVGRPLVAVLIVALPSRMLIRGELPLRVLFVCLGGVVIASFVAAFLVTPATADWLRRIFRGRQLAKGHF